MTTIIELEGYRVETFQEAGGPRPYSLPERTVRIVRKFDGAFVELDPANSSDALFLLWERANGTPEAATREWVKEWIADHEEGAKYSEGEPYWLRD